MIRKISITSTIFDAEAEHIFSLSDENTFIYKPARFGNAPEIQGKEEICKK